MKTQMRIFKIWLASVCLIAWNSSNADLLDLATAPLFLGTSIDANVFFEVDDSGSMDWESLVSEYDYYTNYWSNSNEAKMTHGLWRSYAESGSNTGRDDYAYIFNEDDMLYTSSSYAHLEGSPEAYQRDWRGLSSSFNLIYYDPTVTYEPWVGHTDQSFTAARGNPQPDSETYDDLRDLTGFKFEVWTDDHSYGLGEGRPDGPTDALDGANGIVDLWDSHTRYTVNATTLYKEAFTVPSVNTAGVFDENCDLGDAQETIPYASCYGTTAVYTTYNSGDVNPWGRTLAQEKQNIANWYSYYRKRSYVAKAAIGAVMEAADDFRYGLSLLNDDDDVFVQVPAEDVEDYADHNASLLEELYDYEWAGNGTPLRQGLRNVGRYFDNDLTGKTDPIISQCQQNFSILLTDGYWTEGYFPYYGDVDGDGSDDNNGDASVSDVAMYFYNKDLSPLVDDVPTSVIDGNNKQHMVTFTVAFGVQGDLVDTDNDGYPNPELASNGDWGDPFDTDQEKIDDLWHAAFNSKGTYVAAQTPTALVSALTEALSEIADRVGSSASVATNSGSLNAGSHLFQARFDSGGWSGQLIAFPINLDGTLNPTESWQASDVLDDQDFSSERVIMTYNPDVDYPVGGEVEGSGVAFRFPDDFTAPNSLTDLNSDQIDVLLTNADVSYTDAQKQAYGLAFLNYLRGDRSQENTGYSFRNRNSALGDIVDSDPQYVGPPRFRYPDSIESTSYAAFKEYYADREPIVYVGANDGMLHGFLEDDGSELIAYIPNEVFQNLALLGEDDYIHRHFVNEPAAVVDAFFPNRSDPVGGGIGAWRSVLVGALGQGGQGLYALDVTDPDYFIEDEADTVVLWEFTDADDADLGYTYGNLSTAKMHNGQWAVIFSNGFNNSEADGSASSTGHAYLYLVDVETGELIRKIDTGAGSTGTPNGLSAPALVDIDQDFVVDYIYAGDLEGNVWKFDMTSADSDDWDVAWKDGSDNPLPLFTALDDQPITTRVQISHHPTDRDGYMVYFGTGKYLESDDNIVDEDTPTQSFYGIWDHDLDTHVDIDRDDLLQQFITNQFQEGFDTDDDDVDDKFNTVRTFSDIPIDYDVKQGWFIDLIPVQVAGSDNDENFGEKQVERALIADGRVIFTTLIPSQDSCDFGGSSYTYQLDFKNGGQLDFPPFDLNGDNEFTADDTYIGGVQSEVGIVPTLSVISDTDSEIAFGSGSSGDVQAIGLNVGDNALGRQSWRQLQ